MIDHIEEELKRRELLTHVIDAIIEQTYISSPKKKLKRGEVQKFIFDQLNINKNNMLCRLINERMEYIGSRLVTIRGDQFYYGVTHRPS